MIEASARIFTGARCGTLVYDEDVKTRATIAHFDSVPLVAWLGITTTEISKHILLDIECTTGPNCYPMMRLFS